MDKLSQLHGAYRLPTSDLAGSQTSISPSWPICRYTAPNIPCTEGASSTSTESSLTGTRSPAKNRPARHKTVPTMLTCIRASPGLAQLAGIQTTNYANDGYVIKLSDQLNDSPQPSSSTINSRDPTILSQNRTFVQFHIIWQPQPCYPISTKQIVLPLNCPKNDRKYLRYILSRHSLQCR